MKGYVGVTDNDWFQFLSAQPDIDEVNFWQPGGKAQFRALDPGDPFFFKLHSPLNFIVGGGFFAHSTILPVSLAWEAFGIKNGASSLLEMRLRVEKYRRNISLSIEDYNVGCILLTQPFFFDQSDWIPIPPDFSLNIVQGKTYNLTHDHGRVLWEQVSSLLNKVEDIFVPAKGITDTEQRYGEPMLITPRLGQGSFRVMVTDAYERRCAITQEKILPALEAAHIKPFSESGPHSVNNGLLLRSDIHRLFDSGYVTVTADQHFEVSKRIHEEFDNGKYYYSLHGKKIHLPGNQKFIPEHEYLSWHNVNCFKG